ncbi:MAG: YdbC family protein [Anaerovoracaceae bacterium]|jgi:hypothetical protein
MKGNEKDREFNYSIEEHIGVIAEESNGWRKELNMVSWNGGAAKFDIRSWDDSHRKMTRGITLHKDEMSALKSLLSEMEV